MGCLIQSALCSVTHLLSKLGRFAGNRNSYENCLRSWLMSPSARFFWALLSAPLFPGVDPRPLSPEKSCVSCGRGITWREKWENCWDDVRYCSDACHRRKPGSAASALEKATLARLAEIPRNSSICPSEIARSHFPANWNGRTEDARMAARRLVAKGLLEVTQNNQVVDASTAKRTIRLRRSR
jgi:hypothetical protein